MTDGTFCMSKLPILFERRRLGGNPGRNSHDGGKGAKSSTNFASASVRRIQTSLSARSTPLLTSGGWRYEAAYCHTLCCCYIHCKPREGCGVGLGRTAECPG